MENIYIIWEPGSASPAGLVKALELAAQLPGRTKVFALRATSAREKQMSNWSQSVQAGKDACTTFSDVEYASLVVANVARWANKLLEGSDNVVIKVGERSSRSFYTSADWQLLRQLHTPLLVASPRKWQSKAVVLATVDVSSDNPVQTQLNRNVLAEAKRWATMKNCDLHVAYVLPVLKLLDELTIIEPYQVLEKKGAEAKAKLIGLLQEMQVGETSVILSAGPPADELAHIASKCGADLVVIGSMGRDGLRGYLKGNTAERIIQKLRTDLLVIHPRKA